MSLLRGASSRTSDAGHCGGTCEQGGRTIKLQSRWLKHTRQVEYMYESYLSAPGRQILCNGAKSRWFR